MLDIAMSLLYFIDPAGHFRFVFLQLDFDLTDIVFVVVAFAEVLDHCQTLYPKLLIDLYMFRLDALSHLI